MILFRTNGGKETGLGHVMRCLSLAKALSVKCSEEAVIFRTNEEIRTLITENGFDFQPSEKYTQQEAEVIRAQNPKMILFDSYLADTDYLRTIKQNVLLVQFDDNNDIYTPVVADVVINGNIHAQNLEYESETKKAKLLLGPEYLIMREEYQKSIKEKKGNGIMITTGGSDFLNLMPKFIKALKDTEFQKRIIIGPAYTEEQIERIKRLTDRDQLVELVYKPKSLKKHIMDSEIVITAAGSTVYEVLRLKRIPIIFTLADNQKKIATALVKEKVVSLGDYKEIEFEKEFIIKRIESAKKSENNYSDLYELFDGKGVFRVVEEINNLVNI